MKKLLLMFFSWGLALAFPVKASAQLITNQPQSVTINNASTATFTVGASNATGYQWQFNGGNLTDSGNIIGSATSSLTLEDVMTNQGGSYSVVVSNSVSSNSVTSSNAVLTLTNGTIVRFNFTNLIGVGTNFIDVQLFDHDKPATVQNFLHYIRAGAYSNMFFDRCVPQFVLQGGDYGATDRTNTNPPITGWDIYNKFVIASNQPNPPFPPQVDSEFNVGPLIHNRFGTLAMALLSGNQNSASSAFFFNLTNNSANLDVQNNGFTVFGRILDGNGTNVLQYFYGLTQGNGIVIGTNFLDQGVLIPNDPFPNLPVNYTGTNQPANSNLVFCDFQVPSNAPVDVIPPTVSIVSSNLMLTNTASTNLIVQGAAGDDVGLAVVIGVLTPEPAADGTYPDGFVPVTNYALGTTNWSVDFSNTVNGGVFPPGSYNVQVQAQDGAGNLSAPVSQPLSITAVITNGNGTVTLTNGAFTNLNAVGYPFQNGSSYTVLATPAAGQLFVHWNAGNRFAFGPQIPFTMSEGFVLTATFISNSIPNSIAFTYPLPNAIISSNAFNITGTIANVPANIATITCQIYSTPSFSAVGPPLTVTGTNTWSVAVSTNLPVDSYIVQAIATNQAGGTTVISQYFSVAMSYPLSLTVLGPGGVSPASVTNGEPLVAGTTFQVTAVPNPGQFFYNWSNAAGVSLNPVQTSAVSGALTLTATFLSNSLPNSIAFTSPPTNVVLSNNAVQVAGTISNIPAPPVTIACQIFSQSTLTAVSPRLTTNATNNWSIIVSNLAAGSYIAQVEALDSAGDTTVITENFNATIVTNLPTVAILSPASNALLLDNNHLIVSGTASGSVALARVGCSLIPEAASDGTRPNRGNYIFNDATGTTNWSLDFGIVPPGEYELLVQALDDAGNVGQQTEVLTNTAIFINGTGGVSLTQSEITITNPIGYPLQIGLAYQAQATPGAGETFVGWSSGGLVTNNPIITFTMSPGVLWTATFAPIATASGLSFIHPTPGAKLTTTNFLLKGRMTASFKTAQITCQITSLSTGFGVGPLLARNEGATWSATVNNLPPDNYLVQAAATNASGLSATISEQFSISPFAEAVGTYTGLFICTNSPVAATNSGFLSFTVESSGRFSGRLVFPAYPAIPIYSLTFNTIGFATGYVPFGFGSFYGHPLRGVIYLDLNGGTDSAVGTISSDAWSSQLVCYRAVTALSATTTPAPGKYILSLQPGPQTNPFNTNGYASVLVAKGGGLALGGALPDNTTFAGSARVSKDGLWPLYAVPAGDANKGMILGWEAFTNAGSCGGQLYWYKASHIGPYYKDGLGVLSNMQVMSVGTNCSGPIPGSPYSIVFAGGTILPPLTNGLTVNAEGQFVVSGAPADKLKISLSAGSVLTGSFLDPVSNKTLRFKGAFISPSQGGSGFIPEAGGETGCFELQPVAQ